MNIRHGKAPVSGSPASKSGAAISEDPIGFALSRALRQWRRHLDEKLKQRGITYATWLTLVYLQRGGQGMRQRELAEFMEIEAPTLVRHLDHLENEGLIERRTPAADRRAKAVYLTPRAEEVLGIFDKAAAETRSKLLMGISHQDVHLCTSVLEHIISNAINDR